MVFRFAQAIHVLMCKKDNYDSNQFNLKIISKFICSFIQFNVIQEHNQEIALLPYNSLPTANSDFIYFFVEATSILS